jgi:hypothetical protein
MLRHDWKKVLTKAWSIRLIAIAFLLTAVEVAFGIFGAPMWIPAGLFAALSGLVSAGAFVARLYAQKEFKDAD